jgi:prepilin-type N-terminal cleavage/methylation domain-containing protein
MRGSSDVRRGVTLIEILVSLLITAVITMTGRALIEQLASIADASRRALDTHLDTAARENELRRMFRLASAPADAASEFDGIVNEVELSTRCTSVRGFDTSCRCRVGVVAPDGTSALVRRCTTAAALDTLLIDSLGMSVIYLADAANGGRWIAAWSRSTHLPRAVGIVRRAAGDTLILRIGERG